MRVCDLTTLYLDGGQGGVNTYLTEKARYLAQHPEVESHLIIVPGRRTRRYSLFGSTVQTIRSPRLPSNPVHRVLTQFRQVQRVLVREAPTVIEVDCSYFLGRVAAAARRAVDVPIVGMYHVHLPTFIARPSAARFGALFSELAERAAWRYVRFCYRHLDRLVVPTPDIRKRLERAGFSNLEHVPFGVNLELFKPNGRVQGGGPCEILYVGRLSREKELGVLIEAFRMLSERGDYRLRIIGDGPMRRRLQGQAAGLDGITFLGAQPYGEALASAYASADLLASPSPAETFNLTILEAFACGLPVVSVRQGGPVDLVTPALGELARPGDPVDFAAKIEHVATRPEAYQGCRRHVEQTYSWKQSFERLLEIYRGCPPTFSAAERRTRFIIIGAGAVGSYLGQALAPKAPIMFAEIDPGVRDAWRSRGYQACSPDQLSELSATDVVVLATKSTVAQSAVLPVPAGVPVISISNGINQALRGRDAVCFGVVDFAVSSTGPGAVQCTRPGSLILSRTSPEDACARLAEALAGSDIRVELSDDIEGHIWSKLLLNASFDPVAAATGLTYGQVFRHKPSLHALRRLLREGVAVARAAGISLCPVQGVSPATLSTILHTPLLSKISAMVAARRARLIESAMLGDVRRGIVTEVSFLNGRIVAVGAEVGVSTPGHLKTVALMNDLTAGRLTPSLENAARFLD